MPFALPRSRALVPLLATLVVLSTASRVHAQQVLGLPVSTDMLDEVLDLMQLYPQTAQRRPSVEYIPVPYGPPERASNGRRQAPQEAHR